MFNTRKLKTVNEILKPLYDTVESLTGMATDRKMKIEENSKKIAELDEENKEHGREIDRAEIVAKNLLNSIEGD